MRSACNTLLLAVSDSSGSAGFCCSGCFVSGCYSDCCSGCSDSAGYSACCSGCSDSDFDSGCSSTIYAEKGDVVYQGETVTTSVAKLALEKLAGYSTTDEARARALADMLNYGASVQTAYSHRADKLANAELGEYASFATTEEPVFDAEDIITGEGSVSVLQYGVSMRSKVEMQFMFTEASIVGCELRIMINGETTEIAADQFEAFSGYAVARVAIKAANLHEIHTIALYNAETGEVVTPVYNVSIEAYAKTQLGGTYNDVFVEMMKYGDAVAAIA